MTQSFVRAKLGGMVAATCLFAACAPFQLFNQQYEADALQRRLAQQQREQQTRRAEAERRQLLAIQRARALARQPRPAPQLVNAMKTGLYECDLSRQVELVQVQEDGLAAVLRWNGQNYQMNAVRAATGALRLEHPGSGLVWLTILGKSILLDTSDGKQLANDCNRISEIHSGSASG